MKQCIGRLKLLVKSMTGEEVAGQIIVLSTEFEIPPQSIVAAMCDRASVNDVAMRTTKIVYNQLLCGLLLPMHTLDDIRDRMNPLILQLLQKLDWFVLTKSGVPFVVEDSNWITCTFVFCHLMVGSNCGQSSDVHSLR